MSYQQGTIRTNFGSGGGPVRQKNTGTHWRFTRNGITYVGRFEDSKESIDCTRYKLSFQDGTTTTVRSGPDCTRTSDDVSATGPTPA